MARLGEGHQKTPNVTMSQLQDTRKLVLKMVAMAFVAANLVYALVVYQSFKSMAAKGQMVFDGNLPLYLSVAGVILLALIKPIRDKIWEFNKRRVTSSDNLYQVLVLVTAVSMAIAESIGVFGLILYFMTGKPIFPEALLAISFIGTVIYFPRNSWIEEKRMACGASLKGYEQGRSWFQLCR